MDDINRMRDGDVSLFNSSLATLYRMHQLFVEANYFSSDNKTTDWWRTLQVIDRELSPYLNDEEEEALEDVRVFDVNSDKRLYSYLNKRLDKYERKLREYHALKGFGLKASDRDPRKAMERSMT